MANQLGKFSPNLAELSQPLRELLSPKHSWLWTPIHQEAFTSIKKETLNEAADVEKYVEMVTENLPAGENRLEQYRQAQLRMKYASE